MVAIYGTPGKSDVTIAGPASDTHGKDNSWGGSFYKMLKKYIYQSTGMS